MRFHESQKITPWGDWQDWRIPDIESRYLEFNRYYVDMIKANMKSRKPTTLCTHHLSHEKLNGHEPGHYNFYSGMKDLLHELPFDHGYNNYVICGHTHRRVIGEVVPNFMCVNVGSDYGSLNHYVLDI